MSRLSSALIALYAFSCGSTATCQIFSPPILLPGDTTIAASAGNQREAAVAAGEGGYLAVWEDDRTGLLSSVVPPFGLKWNRDIYAMLLDEDGKPRASAPIVVNQDTWDQVRPKVAWNGSLYLVVWESTLTNVNYRSQAVLAARVTATGQVLDPNPILIEDDPNHDEGWPSVASAGGVFLVTWSGFTAGGNAAQVQGRIVQPDGTVGARVGISAASSIAIYNQEAAGAANRFLVVHGLGSTGSILGQLVDTSGAKVGGAISLAGSGSTVRATSNGATFYAAWLGGGTIRATPVDLTGVAGVPGGQSLIPGGLLNNSEIAVGWDGSRWVAAWDVSPAIRAVTVDPSGTQPSAPIVVDTSPRSVDDIWVGSGNGKALVLWTDRRETPNNFGIDPDDVFGATLAAGIPSTSAPVSVSPPAQVNASIAGDAASGYILTYQSLVAGSTRLLGQRLNGAGDPLGGPFEIAGGDRSFQGGEVAFNGQECLATWHINTDPPGSSFILPEIYRRRFLMDGTMLDPGPLFVMNGNDPDAAAVGSTFLIISRWHHNVFQSNSVVHGQRIDGVTGAAIGGIITLDNASGPTDIIGFDDRWMCMYHGVRVCFVFPDGSFQAPFYAANDQSSGTDATVTRDGDQAVIAFRHNGSLVHKADIRARRFLFDATPLDPLDGVVISDAFHGQQTPVAAPTLDGYLFAWTDYRAQATDYEPGIGDVMAARLDGAGQLVDPFGVTVHDDFPRAEGRPVAAGDAGHAILVSTVLTEGDFTNLRQVIRVRSEVCAGAGVWLDLGHALPGAAGAPTLTGAGSLIAGTTTTLAVANAASQAPLALIFGITEIDAPFSGGVLVPSPDLVIAGFNTNVAGGVSFGAPWPAGVPSCLSLTMQAWIQDPTGPFGLTASNALRVTTP